MTKKQLQDQLDAAERRIAALETQLRTDEVEPDDQGWADLRDALAPYTGKDADRQDLVREATDIVRRWADLPEIDWSLLDDRDTDDLADALDLWDALVDAVGSEPIDLLAVSLFRARVLVANEMDVAGVAKALGRLV